ncbi:S8 family serine peptidase [Pontibacter sp. JH31]|uniref:S8 family serine peptidase n=1 Tax=Pontibacter aquaedesilientis TaxID=2766980 RepID=A0ABR7XK44_9BACT|nr:S8/S53 family peptidase [Pontibacter aquaedesilientis]MBD1397751.1 S8 family serine peptidase [Pontibacter aquaedesilientis]
MRKILTVFAFCLLAVSQIYAQAFVDSKLQSAITDKTKLVQVVVTFKGEGAPSLLDLTALTQAGITKGLTLKSLPIAGVLATGLQVEALAKSSRVLSLYLNESLQYENNTGTALTGVDKLRKEPLFTSRNGGFPVSGKGIGVLVNDSGVDGTHPDLQFGKNLKQNVTAATNLNSISGILPYTPIENVPNTDATGGHGTHVAGIVGGTGQASKGLYEGVAPGAGLVGYGSGAALLLLDVLSGFDYAITNQARYNIRVITNSFGTTSDTGTEVNPADPITLATKRCVDRNIVVVFSAGNSGPGSGTMTGQYKKAPWVIAVAAGDKSGRLASFSSRGIKGKGGSFTLDGQAFTWEDRPTVTSPGVDIIAARVIAPVSSLSAQKDAAELEPAHVPYYTHMSGTSMAAPHVAGIVALLLEANPTLTPYQVKAILQQTATNIPNREKWEVGAGYVNAFAAVDRAYRATAPYGSTLNMNRVFNSGVNANTLTENFVINYNPATTATNTYTFNVAAGTTSIEAKIRTTGLNGETGNPVSLSLVSPSGAETRSGIPALFALSYDRGVAVASPQAGTWTVRISGLNGVAFPEQINGVINMMTAAGTTGLADIAGHPAEASIKMAVSARLMDGLNGGGFKPNELLKRIDMADYLVMGEAIRQYLPVDGSYTLTDVKDRNLIAESVTARGAAQRDKGHQQNGIMLATSSGKFSPNGKVSRADVAYSLVQALGLQEFALQRNGKTPTVELNGTSYPIEDAATIPAGLEGYVSVALELNIINAFFSVTQGPYDLQPVLHATFKPLQDLTRADFAVIITRTHGLWNSGQQPLAAESTSNLAISEEGRLVSYPNPFSEKTTIRYSVEQAGPVLVEVYDVLGKKVRTLVSESKAAGDHSVDFRAENLPSGTYIYRVEAGSKVYSNRMLLTK